MDTFREIPSDELDMMLDQIAHRGKKHAHVSAAKSVKAEQSEAPVREHIKSGSRRVKDSNDDRPEHESVKHDRASHDKSTLSGRVALAMSNIDSSALMEAHDYHQSETHGKHKRGHANLKIAHPDVRANTFAKSLRDYILPNEDYLITIDVKTPIYKNVKERVWDDKKHKHKHTEWHEVKIGVDKDRVFSAVPDDVKVDSVTAGWRIEGLHGKRHSIRTLAADQYTVEKTDAGWMITNLADGKKEELSERDFSVKENKRFTLTNTANGSSYSFTTNDYLSNNMVITNVGVDSQANPYYKGKETFLLGMSEIADLYKNVYYDKRLEFNPALASLAFDTCVHQGSKARNKILSDVMRELTPEGIGIESQQAYARSHNGAASTDLDDYRRLTNNDIAILREIESKYPGVVAASFERLSKNRTDRIAENDKYSMYDEGWKNRHEKNFGRLDKAMQAKGIDDIYDAHEQAKQQVAEKRQEIESSQQLVSKGTNQFILQQPDKSAENTWAAVQESPVDYISYQP